MENLRRLIIRDYPHNENQIQDIYHFIKSREYGVTANEVSEKFDMPKMPKVRSIIRRALDVAQVKGQSIEKYRDEDNYVIYRIKDSGEVANAEC